MYDAAYLQVITVETIQDSLTKIFHNAAEQMKDAPRHSMLMWCALKPVSNMAENVKVQPDVEQLNCDYEYYGIAVAGGAVKVGTAPASTQQLRPNQHKIIQTGVQEGVLENMILGLVYDDKIKRFGT